MHYDWKNEVSMDGLQGHLVWFDETLLNELSLTKDLLIFITLICWLLFTDPEALAYENFMWGDVGLVVDVRFYGVAPHWYFRPFMAWLIICPHHKTGIFGLLYFFLILFFQPLLHGSNEENEYFKRSFTFLSRKINKAHILANNYVLVDNNLYTMTTFYFFVMACLYTTSFLPYGRFYNRVRGNNGSLLAYFYIFSYLLFPFLRKPYTVELVTLHMFKKAKWLWR